MISSVISHSMKFKSRQRVLRWMILLRNGVLSYPRVSSSFLGAEILESGNPEAFGKGLHVC